MTRPAPGELSGFVGGALCAIAEEGMVWAQVDLHDMVVRVLSHTRDTWPDRLGGGHGIMHWDGRDWRWAE